MSLPRPSGLKPPSKIGRPTGLPTAKTTGIPAPGARTQSPEPLSDNSINTDDFKIGDRVWVSGSKPGMIAFIGEAQFAPGEWAGVVLDEPVGKNDGSVMGVRYFQCEAKRGVFSRLSKLSHTPQSPSRPPSQGHDSSSSETKSMPAHSGGGDSKLVPPSATTNGTTAPTSSIPARPSSRLGMSASKTLSTSQTSLSKASGRTTPTVGGTTAMRLPGTMPGGVKVGDRVLVSGSKPGILRYIGETDFAKGVWAGVELDDPLGKNDGAVAGKRYFDCKPMHGLFAPVHKIARAGSATSTPSPHSRPLMSTSLRSSRERSGSQESVSSISSTASSVSRSRVRLGVTSLANQANKTGQRPSTLNLSATTAALQKALKEKEEHIEQLLRERDLERSEVARAAAHVDEAEGQLSSMKTEQDRLRIEAEDQITKYRTMVADLENEKTEIMAFLEEEKRKVEDLQFQLEEETLKDDGDSKDAATDEFQLKELERQAKKEKERADRLEKDLHQLKQKLDDQQKESKDAEAAQISYLDQIEELTYKLTQAEAKAKAFESSRVEDGARTSQVSIELAEKSNRVKELEEQIAAQRREMSAMNQQLTDVQEELKAKSEKRQKQDEYIQELTNKLKNIEDEHKQVMDELRNANSNSADLQRKLTASEAKAEELANDRSKLEEQLSELVKNSGDSSSQLASLNAQVTEKNRKIEDLQNDLSSYSQSLAKTNEDYQQLRQEKDREIQETTQNYEGRLTKLQDEVRELNSTVEKSKARITQVTENLEEEKKEAVERKETEIRELQQQLLHANNELRNQEDKTTAHKQLLDKVTGEKDTLQYEKQQVHKQLKRVEEEKAAMNTELIQARMEVSSLKTEMDTAKGASGQWEDKVEKLTLEIECLTKAKTEAEKAKEEVKSQKSEVVQERDSLQKEMISLKGELQKKDIQLEDVQKEVERLKSESSKKAEELMAKSQSETDLLTHELGSLRISLQEAKDESESKEFQIAELQAEVEQNKALVHERDLLIKEKEELLKEKEATEEKCRGFIKEIEKQSHKADELDSELKTVKSAEGALKREKSTLESRIQQLESDLETAKWEVTEAKSKAAAASEIDMSDDAVYTKLKEEADSSKGQVDFLNSVIVELQNKNQDLQHRLSAMEDSGIHTNGDFSEPTETPSRTRAPPRLFCDICDVFDQHDTEDCPMQAMEDSPDATRYHGDPKNSRPYCEICEVFSELCECGAFSHPDRSQAHNKVQEQNIVTMSPVCTLGFNTFKSQATTSSKWDKNMPSTDSISNETSVPKNYQLCLKENLSSNALVDDEDEHPWDPMDPDFSSDLNCPLGGPNNMETSAPQKPSNLEDFLFRNCQEDKKGSLSPDTGIFDDFPDHNSTATTLGRHEKQISGLESIVGKEKDAKLDHLEEVTKLKESKSDQGGMKDSTEGDFQVPEVRLTDYCTKYLDVPGISYGDYDEYDEEEDHRDVNELWDDLEEEFNTGGNSLGFHVNTAGDECDDGSVEENIPGGSVEEKDNKLDEDKEVERQGMSSIDKSDNFENNVDLRDESNDNISGHSEGVKQENDNWCDEDRAVEDYGIPSSNGSEDETKQKDDNEAKNENDENNMANVDDTIDNGEECGNKDDDNVNNGKESMKTHDDDATVKDYGVSNNDVSSIDDVDDECGKEKNEDGKIGETENTEKEQNRFDTENAADVDNVVAVAGEDEDVVLSDSSDGNDRFDDCSDVGLGVSDASDAKIEDGNIQTTEELRSPVNKCQEQSGNEGHDGMSCDNRQLESEIEEDELDKDRNVLDGNSGEVMEEDEQGNEISTETGVEGESKSGEFKESDESKDLNDVGSSSSDSEQPYSEAFENSAVAEASSVGVDKSDEDDKKDEKGNQSNTGVGAVKQSKPDECRAM